MDYTVKFCSNKQLIWNIWNIFSSFFTVFFVCFASLFLFIFYWIFSLFTFQMFSPFQVFPLETPYPILPPTTSRRVLPIPPTHSCLPALGFPYTGASKPLRPSCRSSLWCSTRSSSATYAARALGPSMCTLLLVVQSPGALRVWLFDTVAPHMGL